MFLTSADQGDQPKQIVQQVLKAAQLGKADIAVHMQQQFELRVRVGTVQCDVRVTD